MKKKYLALCSVALLSTLIVTPVSAATENSTAEVTETSTVSQGDIENDAVVKECEVEVTVAGSGFTVTIPKKMTLSGESYTANYEVSAKGDISGTEKLTVTPDATFELKQDPKDPVTAGVSQEKTEFLTADLSVVEGDVNVGATTTGEVFADGRDIDDDGTADVGTLSAGAWEGTFNFVIAVEEVTTN